MIESMTGFGAAARVEGELSYALEIRSVNHRYLKLTIKLPDALQHAEILIDKAVRQRVARGSVICTLRVRGAADSASFPINVKALQSYVNQLVRVDVDAKVQPTIDLAALTALPGVCALPEADDEFRAHQAEIVESLCTRAMDALVAMRREEGRVLRGVVRDCCEQIRAEVEAIGVRAPGVIDEYYKRLRSRVEILLKQGGVELEADALAREVAVYAERCDISEEITRLRSHLGQIGELCDSGAPVGRTLDFLTQELLREANTIASKSNDAAITRGTVVVKGLIDRIKEQVQNVE